MTACPVCCERPDDGLLSGGCGSRPLFLVRHRTLYWTRRHGPCLP